MKTDTLKKIVKLAIPLLLALGAAYGYVDSSCTCAEPAEAMP